MGKKVLLSCDEMVKKVVDAFVVGADPKFLKKVTNAAKGGGALNSVGKALATKDGKYAFMVEAPFFFLMKFLSKSRNVLFLEKETGAEYTMPKNEYAKFYQAVKAAVDAELAK